MREIFLIFIVLISSQPLTAQLASSNLPIIRINTGSQEIVDEPKINASMGIIYNGEGQRNDASGALNHYDARVGIEIRGSTSQWLFPKDSYGFETRDENNDDLSYALLGLPEEEDWVLHAPYSDKSLIRNALTYRIAGELMEYAPRIRFAEVILNQEYKGVYLLTEKIKRDKNRVDVSKLNPEEIEGDDLTGGYILKLDKTTGDEMLEGFTSKYSPLENEPERRVDFLYHYPKPEDIVAQQKSYIKNYIYQIEDALKSDAYNDPQNGYRKYLDVESFIDFIIVNEISKNVDGYRLSTFFYKDKDSDGGKLKAGPVWDFNLAFGNANYCDGGNTSGWAFDFNDFCPADSWVIHFWWDRLMSDPYFVTQLKNRWFSLREDFLSTGNLLTIVDSMTTLLDESQARNFIQWPVLDTYIWPNNFVGGSYFFEIEYLKQWIRDRLSWLDNAMGDLTLVRQLANSKSTINLFPNPFDNELSIELDAPESGELYIKLFNTVGKEMESFRTTINVGKSYVNWAPQIDSGLYFFSIQLNGKALAVATVVKH